MKYIVILGDGMADEPLEQLEGKTPLEYAHTPVLDELAGKGEMGLVQNVPAGMAPGSDVANLSVLGYDPRKYYTGRSPLEALSLKVSMEPEDAVFRCNLVTVTEEEEYENKIILDHSAGEISTADADILTDAVRQNFQSDEFRFCTGTSYRELFLWKNGTPQELVPPYDCLGQAIGGYLPTDPTLRRMMEESFDILNNHPLNLQRAASGIPKANSIWFWGAGTKPGLENFSQRTGLRGAMISAVDLLKGIAVGSGMEVISVEGATGTLHTNYEGKAQAAVNALLKDGFDFVYIHLEAPDEMGHQGSAERKVQAIEYLDSRIAAPVRAALNVSGEAYRMLILPDHPTPVRIRTHTADPVPYLIFDSTRQQRKPAHYCEKEAAQTGNFHPNGWQLMEYFLKG